MVHINNITEKNIQLWQRRIYSVSVNSKKRAKRPLKRSLNLTNPNLYYSLCFKGFSICYFSVVLIMIYIYIIMIKK